VISLATSLANIVTRSKDTNTKETSDNKNNNNKIYLKSTTNNNCNYNYSDKTGDRTEYRRVVPVAADYKELSTTPYFRLLKTQLSRNFYEFFEAKLTIK